MITLSQTKQCVLNFCVNQESISCRAIPGSDTVKNLFRTGHKFTAEDKDHLIHGLAQQLPGKPFGLDNHHSLYAVNSV